jgi:hypothetical protein
MHHKARRWNASCAKATRAHRIAITARDALCDGALTLDSMKRRPIMAQGGEVDGHKPPHPASPLLAMAATAYSFREKA